MKNITKFSGIILAAALLLPLGAFAKQNLFSGIVTSLDGANVLFNTKSGTSYSADTTNSQVLKRTNVKMNTSDIKQGDSVNVLGVVNGTNITASTVRDISQPLPTKTITGQVTAVNVSSFTVSTKANGSQTVDTDSNTVFKKNGQTASLADVVVGVTVTATGTWDNAHTSIAATRVSITIKTVSVTGTVSGTPSGMTITINGKNSITYSIDATNAKLVRRYGAAMQIGDIQNGDTLAVTGPLIGTNITATLVRNNSLQAHNGTFVGTVSAVSSPSFTLQSKARGNQTINTNSTTVFKQDNKTVDFSALAVGETVTVSGVWDRTNANVTASKVTVKMMTLSFIGTLQSVSGTNLTVATSSTVYSVDASKAVIMYKGGRKGDTSILQTNDQVKVIGKAVSGSTNVAASSVRDMSQVYTKPVATPLPTATPSQ